MFFDKNRLIFALNVGEWEMQNSFLFFIDYFWL